MTKEKTHLDCTPKEDAIARERALTNKSLAQCYLDAGYSSRVKVPRVAAARALNKPHVQERVDYYRSMMAAKLDIRSERIMAEFAAIAFADPLDAFDIDESGYLQVKSLDKMPPWARRSIMSIKSKRRILDGKDENDVILEEEIEVKFHPKVAALTKIAEIKNMFKEHEKNKTPKVNIDISFQGAR